MDRIERGLPAQAPVSPERGPARRRRWRAGVGLAAVAALLGAAAWLGRRSAAAGPAAPGPGPAGKTLAWRSPAVLRDTPRRRFAARRPVARAITIEDLRAIAHRRLPGFVLEYLEAGSEDEASLARNAAALAEWRLTHRSLVDVSRRNVASVLFERPMTIPVAVAPTGLNGLFWPHADLRLAEAAAEFGVPFAQSTMSNEAMVRVARVPGLRYWWQLYVFGPPEVHRTLIDQAREAACEALIVTVDAQIYGNREWHKRTMAPGGAPGRGALADALRHPRWLGEGILSHGMPRFPNILPFVPAPRRGFFDSARWVREQMDRALTWETVSRIRDRWPRKLIVKGLLDIADIARAAAIGADAAAISNHGGRQLDWAASPLDLLPAARREVGDRLAIIVDGGIRRGTDIVKALALGADAVFAGRALLYGVAAGGRAGATRALDILREELDRDLALLGVRSVRELGPHLLMRPGREAAAPHGAGWL